jgi:hypothetical protein
MVGFFIFINLNILYETFKKTNITNVTAWVAESPEAPADFCFTMGKIAGR